MTVNRKPIADLVREVLACPVCHGGLVLQSDQITCRACTFQGSISEDVVLLAERTAASFFDDRFGVMQQGHAMGNGEWQLCYEQQLKYLEPYLGPGKRVLDVGCGPAIPYKRDPDCFLIGLEASYPSVRANRAV